MTLYGEGSNASSTNKERDLSQSSGEQRNSFYRMREDSDAQKGVGMLIRDPLGEGSNASSTDSELWRAEKSTLRMKGNSDALKGAARS